MIIVRLLSPGPWLVGTTKVYPGVGADIVMESITLGTPKAGMVSVNGIFRQLRVSPCAVTLGHDRTSRRDPPNSRLAKGAVWADASEKPKSNMGDVSHFTNESVFHRIGKEAYKEAVFKEIGSSFEVQLSPS